MFWDSEYLRTVSEGALAMHVYGVFGEIIRNVYATYPKGCFNTLNRFFPGFTPPTEKLQSSSCYRGIGHPSNHYLIPRLIIQFTRSAMIQPNYRSFQTSHFLFIAQCSLLVPTLFQTLSVFSSDICLRGSTSLLTWSIFACRRCSV